MSAQNVLPARPPRKRRASAHPAPAAITGRVYLASSLPTYGTARYGRMLARTGACFPRADVLPSRDLYASNQDWRERWPHTLAGLSGLVFIDHKGGIGAGVFREVADARGAGVPVWYLPHHDADPIPYDDAGRVILFPHARSLRRFAEVVYELTPDLLDASGANRRVGKGAGNG